MYLKVCSMTDKEIMHHFNNGDDAKILRKILGQFATGVAIATGMDSGKPFGLTINSFTSVSLEPPLILFCIKNSSTSLPLFQNNSYFALNVLDGEQKEISQKFAANMPALEKFAEVDFRVSDNNLPILYGNIATLECEKYAIHEGGDHKIIIGKVLRAFGHNTHDPLVYWSGSYKKIHI